MSDRAGNLGTDLAGAAGKIAVGKLMAAIFGSTGAIIAIPVAALLVLVILVGGGGTAQQAEATPGSGGGYSCTVDGESAIPEPYREALEEASKVSKIPVEILAAQLEQESNWNPTVVSSVGARGIAQFMPGTWASYGNGKDPFDPIAGIEAQGRYMAYLRNFMQKNFGLNAEKDADQITDEKLISYILAGYNAGPGNVQKFAGVPPFAETRKYVEKILANAQSKYANACDLSSVGDIGSGKWGHPNPGSILKSPFGPRKFAGMNYHYGIDLARGAGQPVLAPTDMEITFTRDFSQASTPYDRGYGTWLIAKQIDPPGYVFEFHHFVTGSLLVKPGQKVAVGTPLAIEGNTGNSSGAHLHFQMAPPGTDPTKPTMKSAIDPLPILKKAGVLK